MIFKSSSVVGAGRGVGVKVGGTRVAVGGTGAAVGGTGVGVGVASAHALIVNISKTTIKVRVFTFLLC